MIYFKVKNVILSILVLLTTELAAEMARLTKGDVDGLEDLEVLEMDARLHMLAVAGTDAEEKVVGNGEKGFLLSSILWEIFNY
jgi:hypothetical protein